MKTGVEVFEILGVNFVLESDRELALPRFKRFFNGLKLGRLHEAFESFSLF